MTRKTLLIIALVLLTFSITGCGTVRGFGEDVENLGQGVQSMADPAK